MEASVLRSICKDDRSSFFLAALGLAGLGMGACACTAIPTLSAEGAVAGYAFSGTVDSELAREFLQGTELPGDLRRLRDELRRRMRPPSSSELRELARRYSPDVATLLFVEAVAADLDQAAVREIYERELERLDVYLRTLSAEQREVFVLTEVAGLTAPEIARLLSIKLNTVYSRLRLARKTIASCIAADTRRSAR